ncbi:sigma-70 family RNA polymerase sigma factor [Lentibacillus sp. N15]|uniref:RNA polymerase sigma factor n=1 Tax=Lentibacillus songyuanensis TaxID=3136161 RepID=UPI0031BBB416
MREHDLELYKRIGHNDEAALEQLYDRYEKLIFSFAYRMTNNTFLSEEVVQEVFTKVWLKKGTYDESKGKFSSWLLTVTRNTSIDLLRKKKETPYELTENDVVTDKQPSTEEVVEWKESGEHIRHAVKHLTIEQQEIIELFYFKGMSQSTIASEYDIPLGTVKGRVRLALKHLRERMTEQQERGVRE